ncbi:MAG: TetR/AcrR family transcriptional regulator [Lachnospiraceae bacterium]|nr:TetR/AcrR family transcriptional regulator [Lachnospiraceae bacterium]
MKKNTDTIKKIQKAAFKEFFEKGYMKASLRKICSDAGVTTGALYFFFKDKDELFCSLVRGVVDEIKSVMLEHFALEQNIKEKDFIEALIGEGAGKEDFKALSDITDIMYKNRDLVLLLLTKAQGSSLENVVDVFIDLSTKQYETLSDKMSKAFPNKSISKYFAHWVAHDQVQALVYAITHIENEDEAMIYISNMILYLRGGWCSVWIPEAFKNNIDNFK